MPNGFLGRRRNPLDLFGGGTMPYLSAPGGYGGQAAGTAAPAPRRTALQQLQGYRDRPQREKPVPIGWKRRLAAAAAAFGAGFGGGPQAGLAVGQQITGGPRRVQEAEYQRGLEEWEAGREKAREAYTLGRQEEFDVRAGEAHERQMKVPIPATPQRAHEYRMEERRPVVPSTRVIGAKTTQYNPASGKWEPIGAAPVYPGREPQRHGSMLEQWLSTAMAQLEKLKNDPLGNEEVIAQATQRIIEQYNKMVPSYPGAVPITELPGAAGQRQPDENDPLGIL